MSFLAEKRRYQRCDSLVCKAMISTDEARWETMELCDISAGGLLFASKHNLHEGMKLYFNLYIYNMLSEFNIKLQGRIVRADKCKKCKDGNTYAVHYENINKYQQVQLDELVKSKISVRNSHEYHETVWKEDECSIFLLPRLRPRSSRLRISNYK